MVNSGKQTPRSRCHLFPISPNKLRTCGSLSRCSVLDVKVRVMCIFLAGTYPEPHRYRHTCTRTHARTHTHTPTFPLFTVFHSIIDTHTRFSIDVDAARLVFFSPPWISFRILTFLRHIDGHTNCKCRKAHDACRRQKSFPLFSCTTVYI